MTSPSGSRTALRRLAGTTVDGALVGLAVLGAVLVLVGSGWGLLLLALPLLALGARLLVTLRRSRAGVLGRAPALRAALAAGTAVAFVVRAGDPGGATPWCAAVAAALLVGGLAVEPFAARAAAFRVPVVAHLPGVPAAPSFPDLRPHVALAGVGASALGLVLAAADVPAAWWLLGCVVASVPLVVLAGTGAAKLLLARRRRRALPAAVAAYAPDVVLYTGRPDDASYQLTMWLPHLRRSGLRFLVVTRNAVPAAALAEQVELPVVEVRAAGDLAQLVVPSLRAAFYVNASSANGAFVRFQHLTHVYLGHGDSDKPPSYNPTHALYDEIFAAGPAATRRYAAHGVSIAPEKFRVVGRPQVEDVLPATRLVAEAAEPVVLYAPTWRGHVEEAMLSSLAHAEQIVAALLRRGVTVIFRPHPFSYDFADDAALIGRVHTLLEQDRRRTGRAHLWGAAAERDRGILDCINASDALVSDVSSVVSDYLQSGKPFAMVAVPAEPEPFVAQYPVAAGSYVVRGDLADLEPQLDLLLGADPLRPGRLALRADYLGDFPTEDYAGAFVRAVQQVRRKPLPDLALDDDEAEGESPTGASRSGEEDDRPLPAGDEDAEVEETADGASSARSRTTGRRRRGGLARRGRALVGPLLELAGTGAALLSLAAALLDAPPALSAVLGVTAVVVILASAPGDLRRSTQGRLLTQGEAGRAVLLVVLAALAADRGLLGGAVALALVVLAVALGTERQVRAAWGRVGLTVVDLPAAVRPLRPLVPRGWLALASHAAIAVGLLLAAGSRPGPTGGGAALAVWGGATAAVLAVLTAVVVQRSLRRAAEAGAGERRLRPALAAHGPRFVLYLASEVRTGDDEVARWLPRLQELDRPFVVVTRSVEMLRHVERLTRGLGMAVPVVHRPTLRSLDDVVVPGLTTAFYVTDGIRNSHFVERRELTHVWLHDGRTDDPASCSPVHAIYDRIVVPDPGVPPQYARHGVRIPGEKFVVAAPGEGFRDVARSLVDARPAAGGNATVPVGERRA